MSGVGGEKEKINKSKGEDEQTGRRKGNGESQRSEKKGRRDGSLERLPRAARIGFCAPPKRAHSTPKPLSRCLEGAGEVLVAPSSSLPSLCGTPGCQSAGRGSPRHSSWPTEEARQVSALRRPFGATPTPHPPADHLPLCL